MCYWKFSTSKSFWINLNPLHGDVVLVWQHQFNFIGIIRLRPAKAIRVKDRIKLLVLFSMYFHQSTLSRQMNLPYLNTMLQFCQSKGEVVDFDGTRALVDGRGQPDHATIRIYQSISVERHLKMPIHTSQTQKGILPGHIWWIKILRFAHFRLVIFITIY